MRVSRFLMLFIFTYMWEKDPIKSKEITGIVISTIREHGKPMSLYEIVIGTAKRGLKSRLTTKETIWKLVEEKQLRFTRNWMVEMN